MSYNEGNCYNLVLIMLITTYPKQCYQASEVKDDPLPPKPIKRDTPTRETSPLKSKFGFDGSIGSIVMNNKIRHLERKLSLDSGHPNPDGYQKGLCGAVAIAALPLQVDSKKKIRHDAKKTKGSVLSRMSRKMSRKEHPNFSNHNITRASSDEKITLTNVYTETKNCIECFCATCICQLIESI